MPKMTRFPPKRVLVPMDFSELSFKAWAFAKETFQPMGAQLEAVYVYPSPPVYLGTMDALSLTAEKKDGLRQRLLDRLGHDAKVTILEGAPGYDILAFARDNAADLIVMGTHGRTGPSRAILGSVAEEICRYSPVPVLTVRDKWKPIRSILVPLNFERYALKGFFAAAELAETFGARIDALFVATEGSIRKLPATAFRSAAKELSDYFERKPPKLLMREGDPAKEIISAAASYDLIVLVAHRKLFYRDWILGTTAERVLRHSLIPVLSVPSEERGKSARQLAGISNKI